MDTLAACSRKQIRQWSLATRKARTAVRRSLVDFFNQGQARSRTRWYYTAVQLGGTAWQAPALRATLNPVWH